MADNDRLAAVLGDFRSRHRPVLRLEARVCDSDRHKWPCHAHRALAALAAVLELHQPRQLYQLVTGAPAAPICEHGEDYDGDAHFGDRFGYVYCKDKPTVKVCSSCADGPDGDEWAAWPCPTHRGITSALVGEADGG